MYYVIDMLAKSGSFGLYVEMYLVERGKKVLWKWQNFVSVYTINEWWAGSTQAIFLSLTIKIRKEIKERKKGHNNLEK